MSGFFVVDRGRMGKKVFHNVSVYGARLDGIHMKTDDDVEMVNVTVADSGRDGISVHDFSATPIDLPRPSLWSRVWKVVVGIGVLVGIAAGVKELLFK